MRFIYTKTFAYFCIGLVIACILIVLNVRGYLEPLRLAVLEAPRPVSYISKGIVSPVRNFFSTIYTLRNIARDNTMLEAKVTELQQQNVLLDQYKLQNDELKKELGFSQSSQLSLLSCGVLSKDPGGFTDALVLSCGEKAGVVVGQAVISQGYLVGKIIFVTANTSTALLITNAQSSVDAKVSKSGTEGVVKGSFGSGLFLDLISQNTEVNTGDIIVTAGINSQVPKNILIGEAGDLLSVPNDLFKKHSIKSPVNFHDLDFVFVVK